MSDDQQERQEAHASGLAQRRGVRWGALAALIVWTLILYAASSGLTQQLLRANSVAYNYSGAVRNHGYAMTIVFAILGFVTYIAPVILGALARTWKGALAFALVPLWLAMLPAIAGSFAGYVPGSLIFGAGPVRLAALGAPMWLDTSRALAFVMSGAIFALLSTTGWVARHAWTHELHTTR